MNKRIPDISVIVPIYNVEAYLERCLNSLIKQTFSEFELILVDDGSQDQCGKICDAFALKDDRIKVIHKENGGLSDARNAGLKIAVSEYIAFVDSDDWVRPDYLELLMNGIQTFGADICECEVVRTSEEKIPMGEDSTEVGKCYSTEEGLKLLMEDQVFHQYVWNKIYKRKLLDNIFFSIGKTNEDEFWTYQVFGNAQRIVKIKEKLYYYFQRDDSIMGATYSLRRLDALDAKIERKKYVDKFFPMLSSVANRNLFESCIYAGQMSLRYLEREQKREAVKKINVVKKICKITIQECMNVDGHTKVWLTMAYFSFWSTCRIKNCLKKGD